jgi:hypothetical protein
MNHHHGMAHSADEQEAFPYADVPAADGYDYLPYDRDHTYDEDDAIHEVGVGSVRQGLSLAQVYLASAIRDFRSQVSHYTYSELMLGVAGVAAGVVAKKITRTLVVGATGLYLASQVSHVMVLFCFCLPSKKILSQVKFLVHQQFITIHWARIYDGINSLPFSSVARRIINVSSSLSFITTVWRRSTRIRSRVLHSCSDI